MQKRREQQRTDTKGLDEAAKELLELNRQERDQMEDEINELRRRNVRAGGAAIPTLSIGQWLTIFSFVDCKYIIE
jgi:hypothetical protein